MSKRYEIITIVVWLIANLILFLRWDDIPGLVLTNHGYDYKSSLLKIVILGWAVYLLFFIFELVIRYFDKKEYGQVLYLHMRLLNIETKFLAIMTLSYVLVSYAFGLTIFKTLVYIFELLIVINMFYRLYKMIQERKRHYR